MEFVQLAPAVRDELAKALRANAKEGRALRMDPLTTGWIPEESEITTEEVISSIKSVPCHYVALPQGKM